MAGVVPRVEHDPIRLAVLVSGGGTTLRNLAEKIEAGSLRARVAVVVCSNAGAAEKVAGLGLGVPIQTVDRRGAADVESFSRAVFEHVRAAEVDLVCLAGFLSLLRIPDDYAWRVLNIHPALLPAFGGKGMYGRRVHEAVLAAGCKVSGCTVHFADQSYDTGPILVQRACPVREGDTPQTLAARVFEQECLAYPEAIGLIGQGRVRIEGRVTRVLDEPVSGSAGELASGARRSS